MVWVSVFLLALAAGCSGQIANGNFKPAIDMSGLEPIHFAGGTLLQVAKQQSFDVGLPLLSSTFYFVEPREEADGPVVDVLLVMEFRAMPIVNRWRGEIGHYNDTSGCSQQTVHSERAEPGNDGQLHCYFHIRHVERACVLGAITNVATVEADVWNDFFFEIAQDQMSFKLNMSGRASDNVSPLIRDIAKATGNVLAAFPLTSSLVFGFDKKIFEALKFERDALDQASTPRNVFDLNKPGEKSPVNDIRKASKLDLVVDRVAFMPRQPDIGVLVDLRTRKKNAILVDQARILADKLNKQLAALPNRGRL